MKKIKGQVVYCGPAIRSVGLQHGAIFRNGIHEHLYRVIEKCPAIGSLFLPVKEYAMARRELSFDLARNMRGTGGKFVIFYKEVQNWLSAKAGQTKAPQTTSGVITHA